MQQIDKLKADTIVMENHGWVLICTTPFGDKNHAFQMRNLAKDSPDWYYELTTCEDAKPV